VIHFFDTSAFVKRYVRERGSEAVRAAFRPRTAAVARITHAEALSAIARAHREGMLTQAQRERVFDSIEADVRELTVVEIRAATMRGVRDLVAKHPLRGYDAVQLVCALVLVRAGSAVTFWSADARLCEAAVAEGLRVPGAAL
jgi:predicted nucleic acid-binding protein